MLMDISIANALVLIILLITVSSLVGLNMLLKHKGPLEAEADFKKGQIHIKKKK